MTYSPTLLWHANTSAPVSTSTYTRTKVTSHRHQPHCYTGWVTLFYGLYILNVPNLA